MLALSYLEASRASIIATLEPVAAIALAMAFLGETGSLPQFVGVGLVLAGIVVLNGRRRAVHDPIGEDPAKTFVSRAD